MLNLGKEKMNKRIEVGSVVQLKSGGPKMTVEWINEDKITCTWHAVYDFRSHVFEKSSLNILE